MLAQCVSQRNLSSWATANPASPPALLLAALRTARTLVRFGVNVELQSSSGASTSDSNAASDVASDDAEETSIHAGVSVTAISR